MRREALVVALIAGYENNRIAVKLEDEDFEPNSSGEWIKSEGGYGTRMGAKCFEWAFSGSISFRASPETRKLEQEAMLKRIKLIDDMPGYNLITTWDQRAVRQATRRAEEILKVY